MAKGKKAKSTIKEKTEKAEKTEKLKKDCFISETEKHIECDNCCETNEECLKDKEIQSELIYDVSDFFKVFGDATRIRMLHLLLISEMCVGDLADKLGMTQSAVSHQLRVLRQSDLVKYRKEGKTVFYSLDDDHVKTVLEQGISHIKHKKEYN